MSFNSEQLRLLANLEQHYDTWLGAARLLWGERLKWKTVNGREYLYCVSEKDGTDTSLGPRDASTEQRFSEFEIARTTRDDSLETLRTDGALYRTLRLPMIAGFAGDVLRELDIRGMLGTSLLVVGTNAVAAYEIEAGERLSSELNSTDDFDLTWGQPQLGKVHPEPPNALYAALKKVDGTYTLNSERQFQIRNSKGYEVELLLPASLSNEWSSRQIIRPVPMPEQDWLIMGEQISHVVCDLDRVATRIVVPDPRWFGLHKLWLSQKPERNPLKKSKDRHQGLAVLTLVENAMPRFPLNAAFEAQIPPDLVEHYDYWRTTKSARAGK